MPRRRRPRLTSRKVKKPRPDRVGNAVYQARDRENHRRKRHLEAVERWKEVETKRLEEAVRRRAKSGEKGAHGRRSEGTACSGNPSGLTPSAQAAKRISVLQLQL